ncbi:hypothetical protein TSUD_409800 [Trifolium subterraneum]|uniref:CCHC-type domain-containing protein n=1 Tax=Trifolium subterraneum TaxID=3900 RepID=A0A2Z6PJ97_TRISU|nr:hypothetical protein TSUD_409800 [Trifolium subterraneum]
MDNDNGFYMVKFDHAADREKVITGGPWLIYDHCLAVSHWSPEFASPNAKVERTIVWVRFPGLNLVYYDESFLLAMASAIGRPIKVDTNTMKVERGRFARVCVEVDLTVPVVGKIWVNGHWYKVQYEGLHIICTNCGCYGHLGRNCPLTNTVPEVAVHSNQQQNSGEQNNNFQPNQQKSKPNQTQSIQDPQNGKILNAGADPKVLEKEIIIRNNEENNVLHGDWLLVSRRRKPTNRSSSNSKTAHATNKGNKFNDLSHLAHQTNSNSGYPKLPPRPQINEIARPNKGNMDPKRRRHDDVRNHETINSPPPTNLSRASSKQSHTIFVSSQAKVVPHAKVTLHPILPISNPTSHDFLHPTMTTHATPQQNTPLKNNKLELKNTNTPFILSNEDQTNVILTTSENHSDDAVVVSKNCEEDHDHPDHSEVDMVT